VDQAWSAEPFDQARRLQDATTLVDIRVAMVIAEYRLRKLAISHPLSAANYE